MRALVTIRRNPLATMLEMASGSGPRRARSIHRLTGVVVG